MSHKMPLDKRRSIALHNLVCRAAISGEWHLDDGDVGDGDKDAPCESG